MREPLRRLRHVQDAIEKIEKYAHYDLDTFLRDELVQTFVIHHLQNIGEALRALPEEFRARYPAVPWAAIIRMRNVLVHNYFGIEMRIVWEVMQEDIPELKLFVHTMMADEEQSTS